MNLHKNWNYFISEFRLRNEKLCSFIDIVVFVIIKAFKNIHIIIPLTIKVLLELAKVVFKGLFKLLLSFLYYLIIFVGFAILIAAFVKTVIYFL